MTGVLQTHSRKHRLAIDMLNFSFKVLEDDYEQVTISPKVSLVLTSFHFLGWCLYIWFVHGRSKMGQRREHDRGLATRRDVLPNASHPIQTHRELHSKPRGLPMSHLQNECKSRSTVNDRSID